MAHDNDNGFTLGDVQVSPSHNTLNLGEKSIKLQPKVMAVLHYLAANHKRVISNEELMERLWQGRVVTHGSVQKSINALRSAFVELIGERDIIAHYSKRGYQLTIEPSFASAITPALQIAEFKVDNEINPKRFFYQHRLRFAFAGVVAILLLTFYGFSMRTLPIVKNHKTVFSSTQGYTNETGHERNAAPHPDNNHVAYIREKFNARHPGETESEIIIRDNTGKDWRIANSDGSWFKLSWSPAGKSLVAVEVKHREGLPLGPNFYEKQNFLYSFHIFSLDLATNRLLEKQLLSQWQGRIFSVTWWDENTLEIVAKQGPNAGNARYRYAIQDQQLKLLDDLEGVTNPIASTVLKKKTAVASLHKGTVQIDFLNENQSPISRSQLDFSAVDISWIPDGSGVLVYAEEERKLFALYTNGEQLAIPLADTKDKIFSRPRFSPDGQAIFYTEEKRSSNIVHLGLDGAKTRLTDTTDLNYSASFSPDGEKVVYASVRNNQTHLWLVENGQERQLTSQPIPKKVGAIVWSADGAHLVYNAGTQIYHHNLETSENALLLAGTERIEPLAYSAANKRLLAVKTSGEVRNLWRIDLGSNQQKQLTFGSVGSAVEYKGDIYFQYLGESALWVLHSKGDALEQLGSALGDYSKLLKVDDHGIYFVSGGVCRESDIYYFQFGQAVKSVFLKRDSQIVATTSFNANEGVLQTECYLPEANIVLLK